MSILHFLGKLFERTEFILFWILVFLVFLGFQYSFVLIFLAVLFVLILVHEWGHFIVAKKTGMRVDEFGIGFPPKVFGYRKGETEYTLNALPIGGFVRILGENGDEDVPLSEADRARTFSARPKWAQALVLVAGVAMNILFAWVLVSLVFMIGKPTVVDSTVPVDGAALQIMNVLPDGPAAAADLPIGATIVSLEAGDEVLANLTPHSFQEFIVSNNGSITLTYDNNGSIDTVALEPATGLVPDDAARPAIGVSLAYTTVVQAPIHIALYEGAIATGQALVAITKGLSGLLAQTVMGTADFSQVAGPVGIAGLVGDAAEFGLTSLILFTAMISLNLAVINLLPIPALDGGRLLFVAIEAITGKEIPAVWMMRVNLIGFALLMLLMILVTYGDITKIL